VGYTAKNCLKIKVRRAFERETTTNAPQKTIKPISVQKTKTKNRVRDDWFGWWILISEKAKGYAQYQKSDSEED